MVKSLATSLVGGHRSLKFSHREAFEDIKKRKTSNEANLGRIKNGIHIGFTLAEVLITLAIIGVVAALTISAVIHKYQQMQLYTQFMKSYNTLSTAMRLAVAEYGKLSDWNWTGREPIKLTLTLEPPDLFTKHIVPLPLKEYIAPFLKVTETCDQASDCFAEAYKSLDGSNDETDVIKGYGSELALLLADGSVLTANESGFVIDTNGKKGPNVMGRDLFYGRWKGDGTFEFPSYKKESESSGSGSGSSGNGCDTSSQSEGNGETCADRMLQEGAMKY